MTIRIYHLGDFGPQAQQMAKHCNNERLAMPLQCVAIGSMIVMATPMAAPLVKSCCAKTNITAGPNDAGEH
jgi:hypothetical protein